MSQKQGKWLARIAAQNISSKLAKSFRIINQAD
jgi:hypothetical protein